MGGTTAAASASAARRAALLFFIAGLLALVHLGRIPGDERGFVALLGLADLAIAAGFRWLPWRQWPAPASLVVVPVAVAVALLFAVADAFPAGTYPLFFMVLYVWLGLSHPPGTSLILSPVVAAGYVAAPLLHATEHVKAESVTLAIPVGILVGEVIARTVRQLDRARREADRRSQLLGGVTRAARTMNALDPDRILTALVDAVLAIPLGFEGAGVLLPDPEMGTFAVLHARGLPAEGSLRSEPAIGAFLTQVIGREETTVVREGPSRPLVIPVLAEAGFQVTAGAPLRVGPQGMAVLVAAARHHPGLDGDDFEALELLAAQAGSTLVNAHTFTDQRALVQELTETSRRDPLTGLGNRLHAANLLGALQPGDGVLLLDLDRFKQVNDSEGHAAGDAVLRRLGTYLRTMLRDQDTARYGGEEFLVVLHQAAESSPQIAERLNRGWRASNPRTTLSIGVAVHRPGDDSADTLARADAALYRAKRTGRDRVCASLHP
jgi:diguanylate cyclase (GGDEF)-like protein